MEKKRPVKLFFCDTETGGLWPKETIGIVQIAGSIYVDGGFQEDLNIYIKPFPGEIITEGAEKTHGHSLESIEKDDRFIEPQSAFIVLENTFKQYVDPYDSNDKFHFVGFNAKFDYEFLQSWFKKNDSKYFGSWFHWPPIDVMNLMAVVLRKERHLLENFRQITIANYLEVDLVEEENFHDAYFDIRITKKLYDIAIERLNGGNKK